MPLPSTKFRLAQCKGIAFPPLIEGTFKMGLAPQRSPISRFGERAVITRAKVAIFESSPDMKTMDAIPSNPL